MKILFAFLYWVLWFPVGLISRLFADPLRRRPPQGSAWLKRPERLNRPSHLKEPY